MTFVSLGHSSWVSCLQSQHVPRVSCKEGGLVWSHRGLCARVKCCAVCGRGIPALWEPAQALGAKNNGAHSV